MKKLINSYDLLQGEIKTFDLNDYCKDVVVLNHHYTSDLFFLDKIRENAKNLGYLYERSLNTLDFEYERGIQKHPSLYEKFNVFTKIDTLNNNQFPNEKIAVYRGFWYYAEAWHATASAKRVYELRQSNEVNVKEVYKDFINIFCGEKGFDYDSTYVMNPINTILILILDDVEHVCYELFPRLHKNYILLCLISTSSPHEIFIAPDIRMNKDSDYQKKIDELKFLLGIKETSNNQD